MVILKNSEATALLDVFGGDTFCNDIDLNSLKDKGLVESIIKAKDGRFQAKVTPKGYKELSRRVIEYNEM